MRRLLATTLVLALFAAVPAGAFPDKDKPKDSDKAAATRKALDCKISVDWKDTPVQELEKDLHDKIMDACKADVKVKIDSLVSGLTRNQKVTYSAKDKKVSEILDEFGKKNGTGYIVVSGKYKKYTKDDGTLLITKGTERGYPE